MKAILTGILFSAILFAHNLQHTVSYEEAVVVSFSFASEGDFSYQSYEVYAPGEEIPFQVGRTDSLARVVFLPESKGKWKIKAFSEDGHGKIIEIEVQKSGMGEKKVLKSGSMVGRALLGLLLLLGIFAFIYFIQRTKNEKNRNT